MLNRKQSEAFEAFRNFARSSEVLSDREKLFVQFASAIALGCQP
jgi:hypothetical protein